jgi:hypothetical protein
LGKRFTLFSKLLDNLCNLNSIESSLSELFILMEKVAVNVSEAANMGSKLADHLVGAI